MPSAQRLGESRELDAAAEPLVLVHDDRDRGPGRADLPGQGDRLAEPAYETASTGAPTGGAEPASAGGLKDHAGGGGVGGLDPAHQFQAGHGGEVGAGRGRSPWSC